VTAQTLNTAGLVIGFFAALFMAFFPPRVRQYTTHGTTAFTFTSDPNPTLRWRGKSQLALSITAPVMLAVGFLLQLVALWMP